MHLFSKKPFVHLSYLTATMILTTSSLVAYPANAYDLEVVLEKRAPVSQYDIAYVPFSEDGAISGIISSDLSNVFTLTSNNLIHQPHSIDDLSGTLPAWQSLGIPYLVIGNIRPSSGNFDINFQVIDLTRNPSSVETGQVSGRDERAVAHTTANRIYEIITGKQADFNARIVYIEETTGENGKISTLKMMDADGENQKNLTAAINGSIFSPAVSPDGRYIAYSVQMHRQRATLWLHNLSNNSVRQLVDLKGDNLSPSFSPDGRSIIFQSSYDGATDIYQVNVKDGSVEKVLDLPYVQSDPSFASSGDGQSFVFASDHASPNHPNIYRATLAGNITRLTYGRSAVNPSYSPDGSKIAYLNGSNAAVMSNTGASITNFGNTGIYEAPSFSPNGERVVYSQGRGNSSIVIRSLAKGNAITKSTQGTVRSPIWIPGSN